VGLLAACSLNPQPDLPAREGPDAQAGGTASGGTGVGVMDPGGKGGTGMAEPSPAGGSDPSGAGGEAPGASGGSPGESGAGGQTNEGGAPSEGGQAGDGAVNTGGHD
jgi:hypothetical protein